MADHVSYWTKHPVVDASDAHATGPVGPLSLRTLSLTRSLLPPGFEWVTLSPNDVADICDFLKKHYVRDEAVALVYNVALLRWYFSSPGGAVLLGVRNARNHKLLAFVSSIMYPMRFREASLSPVAVNFLCLHSKLRSRRLVPLLIQELVKRSKAKFRRADQAIYTSGAVLPGLICSPQYYHRYLTPARLVETGFATERKGESELPRHASTNTWSRVCQPDVLERIRVALSASSVGPDFDASRFRHWHLSRKGVIDTFLHTNGAVVSGYWLDLYMHQKEQSLKAYYVFFMTPTCSQVAKPEVEELMVRLRNAGGNLVQCLNIRGHPAVLTQWGFSALSSRLHYYMYNWKCPPVRNRELGVVLV